MFVLEKLWKDGLTPSEKYTRKDGDYYKVLLKLSNENDKVCIELTDKGKECFENFCELQSELRSISDRETFIEAFRLGARFVLDIVGEYRGQFHGAEDE